VDEGGAGVVGSNGADLNNCHVVERIEPSSLIHFSLSLVAGELLDANVFELNDHGLPDVDLQGECA
jgi:hypothetical protein